MKREDRYIIIKIKDAENYLNDTQKDKLTAILNEITESRILDLKSELKAVVIENDWPEYEVVWKMLENRIDSVMPIIPQPQPERRT